MSREVTFGYREGRKGQGAAILCYVDRTLKAEFPNVSEEGTFRGDTPTPRQAKNNKIQEQIVALAKDFFRANGRLPDVIVGAVNYDI
jgi:hypothetical protein